MRTLRGKLHSIVVVIAVTTLGGCASNFPTETTVSLKEDEANTRGALAFAGAPGKTIPRPNSRGGAVNSFFLDQAQEKRIGLKLEIMQVHPLKKKMEFSSTVEAPFEHTGVVTSVVHGVVTRVLADLGETVKAGQTLAYISSPDISEAQSNYLNAVAKVQEARAQLQQLKTKVELVNAEVDRAKLLNQEGIAATKEVQLAQSKRASVLSDLAAANAVETAALAYEASTNAKLQSLGLSTKSLSDKSISYELPLKSPVNGVVVQRAVSPGQSVGLTVSGISPSDPHNNLFTIADLSTVWVMLEVPQSEVSALKLGTPVIFRTEVAPDQVFHGRVTRLGQNFDAASRTVAVRTEIPNQNSVLKPGMLILATVMLDGQGRSVLSVPYNALQQIQNEDVVFVKVADGKYEKHIVKLGERTPEYSEVISGVKAGEQVVTNGSFFLKSEAVRATTGATE